MSIETAVKNLGGRPRKFSSVSGLESKARKYFNECLVKEEPITITGLAINLGTTRETLMDYESGKYDDVSCGIFAEGIDSSTQKKFSDAIKKIKQVCQHYAEVQMYEKNNPAGAIFALKNYNWSDKQEIDMTTKGEKLGYIALPPLEEEE